MPEMYNQSPARPEVGVGLELQAEQSEFHFHTNPERVSQILSHLLKMQRSSPRTDIFFLEWHTDKERRRIIFSVSDTGTGISADKQEFVFERFAKVDTFVQGTGLGLP